jgi:integrase
MKQSKQSQLIHIWKDYEFYLNIPKSFTGSNKPFIYFYYFDIKANKLERIRKYVGKNNGNLKKVKDEAKGLVLDLVTMLGNNWNPITNLQNEVALNSNSSIVNCIDYWLGKREEAFKNQSIGKTALKNNKILMAHFKSHLEIENLCHFKASSITSIHIREFLDAKAYERNWGKVTYNTYLVDLGTMFNYLKELKIVADSPCDKVSKKNTKFDSSRFKVFEKEELLQVSSLLSSDRRYFGLHLAMKLLFKYNIRPLEIIRLQIRDVDFNNALLTIPHFKTKNRNDARFKLDAEIVSLLKAIIQDHPADWFIFGGRNKPGAKQMCDEYFGQNWRYFKKQHDLPSHLKLYAIKHTSNYYDIENGASFEEIRQRNRHANLQVTTLYVKERLFKNIIKPSGSTLF